MATVTEPSVLPTIELVESDGEPMDSPWHRDAMHLLIEQVRYRMQGCRDYFVGGNMFIYFNLEQARNRDFRGPDFFYVKGVRYEPFRLYYVVWDEGGKYPDVIMEYSCEENNLQNLFDGAIKVWHAPDDDDR